MAKHQRGLWNNSLRGAAKKAKVGPQEVARVAYQLYEQRGREDGHDLEDWLKAEATLRQHWNQG